MKKTMVGFAALLFLTLGTFSGARAAQITLRWDYNVEPQVTGYKIHYGVASGVYDITVNVGNINNVTIHNLQPGVTYYFAATAYDGEGNESGYSNEINHHIPLDPIVISDGENISGWVRISGSGSLTSVEGSLIFSSLAPSTNLSIWKISLMGPDLSSLSSNRVIFRLEYLQPTNSLFIIKVSTSGGERNLYYQAIDGDRLGISSNIYLGLGSSVKNGGQIIFSRNIQLDLWQAQPGINLKRIRELLVYVFGAGQNSPALFIDDLEVVSE